MATTTEALCVRVLWGERRVATHLLRGGDALALNGVGEAVAAPHAPMKFDAASLTFHEGIVGTLVRNGETELSLGDAVHRGLAVESSSGWSLALGRSDVVRLGKGPVHVEAFRVRAPPKATAVWQPDYDFLNTLLVCVAVFFAFALQASLNVEVDADDFVAGDLTRMRHILVKAEQPPPPKKTRAESKEPSKQPARREASEGKPKPPDKPTRDTGGSTQLAAKELTGRIFGGRGASGVFGPGGLGKELAGAMGGVVAMNGDGNGGWSIKGDGGGGPRDSTIQVGGIARSGVDRLTGIGSLCAGPGPCKKEQVIDMEPGPTVVCGGGTCMDKELIRKVINSHRDQIRFCYEQALIQAPSLGGKVAVQFFVATAGSVSTARVAQSTADNQLLSDCLVSRVRTWQFPVAKGAGGYSVTYPFVFKRAG